MTKAMYTWLVLLWQECSKDTGCVQIAIVYTIYYLIVITMIVTTKYNHDPSVRVAEWNAKLMELNSFLVLANPLCDDNMFLNYYKFWTESKKISLLLFYLLKRIYKTNTKTTLINT